MRTYESTRKAGYAAYVVQSIVNNVSPLLFIIYQTSFKISYATISSLVFLNFITQLFVDLTSTVFIDKIGYRNCILSANILSAVGLCLLPTLPYLIAPFWGLAIATVIMAIGSGLIEVLVSPLIENLPTGRKAASMSFLHSFYCWGQVAVIVFSTLFLYFFGHWRLVPILWAIIPIFNTVNFLTVPIVQPEKEKSASVTALLKNPTFLCLFLIMFCSGASEMTMSQWASLFAEKALSLPKIWGDLLGPCGFAIFMGTGRVLFGIFGEKLNIYKSILWFSLLCIGSYLMVSLAPTPAVSLCGCMICGFSVSLFWPGCFSLGAATLHDQGTAMFALLAMGGDLGCATGPWISGMLAGIQTKFPLEGLQFGLFSAVIFPVLLLIGLLLLKGKAEQ